MFVWDDKAMGIKCHPAAEIVPMMQEEAYEAFRDAIEIAGQNEPCILWRGQLLDGRNRWRACIEIGRKPECEKWPDNDPSMKWGKFDPYEYVAQANLHRRDLNASQKAVAAVKLWEAQRNKGQRFGARTIKQLAAQFGVSPRYINAAAKLRRLIKQEQPELVEQEKQVLSGKTRLTAIPEVDPTGKKTKRTKDSTSVPTQPQNAEMRSSVRDAWQAAGKRERRDFVRWLVKQPEFSQHLDRPKLQDVEAAIAAAGSPWALDATSLAASFVDMMEQQSWQIASKPVIDWNSRLCLWLTEQEVMAA